MGSNPIGGPLVVGSCRHCSKIQELRGFLAVLGCVSTRWVSCNATVVGLNPTMQRGGAVDLRICCEGVASRFTFRTELIESPLNCIHPMMCIWPVSQRGHRCRAHYQAVIDDRRRRGRVCEWPWSVRRDDLRALVGLCGFVSKNRNVFLVNQLVDVCCRSGA